MKLIMENWKRFIAEGAGGTRGANKTNPLEKYEKMYKDALYLYYAVIFSYFATDTYLEKGRVPAEDEVEEILKKAKSLYINKAYDGGLGVNLSDHASRLDKKISQTVLADEGRGHDSDLIDVLEYLRKELLSEPED